MTKDVNDTKRLNYFTGEFLQDKDFIAEQTYHLGMRRRHNQMLHGYGIAGGLAVTRSDDHHVLVAPGMAFDKDGQEIVITFPVTHEVQSATPNVYLTIKYSELKIDEDVVHEGGANDAIRWTERPVFGESSDPPPPDGSVIILARIVLKADAAHTIDTVDTSVAQKAAVSVVAPGTIGEAQLAPNSVTAGKLNLAAASIDGSVLKDASVAAGKLNLLAGSIDGSVLKDASVVAGKLNLLAGSVDGSVLKDATVPHDKLAAEAVQNDKIKLHTITTDRLVEGAIGFPAFHVTSTKGPTSVSIPGGTNANPSRTPFVTDASFAINAPQLMLVSLTTSDGTVSWSHKAIGANNNQVQYGIDIVNTAAACTCTVRIQTVELLPFP